MASSSCVASTEMLYIIFILPKLQIAKLGKIEIKQLAQSHIVISGEAQVWNQSHSGDTHLYPQP